MRWLGLSCVLLVAGCPAPIPGSDGGRDAPPPIDVPPTIDAPPPVDAPSGVDAPLLDGGPPPESCTPLTTGAVPADEDLDGAIDEGCPWSFGAPHPVMPAHAPQGAVDSGFVTPRWVSDDGLRLYFVGADAFTDPDTHYLIERAARSAEFGPRVAVDLGTDASRFASLSLIALDADELEGTFVGRLTSGGDDDVYRASRGSRTSPFGAFTRVDELSHAGAEDRFTISRDGLEAIVRVSGANIYRARRATRTAAFGALELVTGIDACNGVGALTADGRGYFCYFRPAGRSAFAISRFTRVSDTSFELEETLDVLSPEGDAERFTPTLSERTGEIFFGMGASSRWLVANYTLARARICRAAACPADIVECGEANARRSPDQLHCYWHVSTPTAGWSAAESACVAAGAHLASIHNDAEETLVVMLSLAPAPAANWIGLAETSTWIWSSGEPYVYSHWGPTEPDADLTEPFGAITTTGPGDWIDLASASHPYVCERTLWPTW